MERRRLQKIQSWIEYDSLKLWFKLKTENKHIKEAIMAPILWEQT